MTTYGYTRVSSNSQENNSYLGEQKQQLIENGILEKNIFVEVGSAANEIKNHPIFQTLINQKLQEGDVLMVTKIERCSRNTLEFLKLQDILFKRKIEFISLDLPHSDDPGINRLIATTLSSIAEFEHNRRKNRQAAGIRAIQKEGKYRGRKTVINKALIQKVKYLKEQKNLSVTDSSKLTGVSTPTISKVLKEHLGYVSNRLVKTT
uniref:Putative serine recombinase n=1 Tax=Kryptoperidinium foliaceum TaxID=160619 RepID=D7PJN2_9DINO|nr:putative serine recombinase [Kryptoperidinium foliaceum]ADI40432.1 putative serine recombinase [Kryptoperidinium foliaceum]